MVSYRAGTLNWALLDLEKEFRCQAEEHAYTAYLDWYTHTTGMSDISRFEVTGYAHSFLNVTTSRKFAVTHKARMGMVPEKAQEGDVVAVLPGGKVPFVLRLVSSGVYEVIGAAYIHGIMMGEAFHEDLGVESITLV